MNQSDKQDLYALVSDVLGYYRQDCSEFTLKVWWQACQPFSMEQVSKAMTAHATNPDNGQFPPKVADIVRILQGTHEDRAILAWGKVLEAMSAIGAYQDVVFDDAAIHAAIADCGGWTKICRIDGKEIPYLQTRFCKAHKAYTGREGYDYPRILNGDRSSDSEYLKRGLPVPKPAVVGDKAIARIVYKGGATKLPSYQLAQLTGGVA